MIHYYRPKYNTCYPRNRDIKTIEEICYEYDINYTDLVNFVSKNNIVPIYKNKYVKLGEMYEDYMMKQLDELEGKG